LLRINPELWDRVFACIPAAWRPAQPGDKVHKLARLLQYPDADAIYRRVISQWDEPDTISRAGREPDDALDARLLAQEFPDPLARMQVRDMLGYLPDDILTKVDRATMAVGLEGRVPLLDHRVITYSWRLPASYKVRLTARKWLLRQVLDRYVPRSLVERPKMGFGVPIDAWLRGPLREWAESLLSPARLAGDGLVRVEPVRRAWQEHLAGSRNWQYPLWTVLMLQAWRARWA
jgi:asparagine synthase (glutamine-hydrolysing)